ncbi:MAG TPA: DUF1552 domain-containing protein [Polyangiaceae bacterium]|nr:DUF1552 domain-containing protein [Polyangiaceae bacterium]
MTYSSRRIFLRGLGGAVIAAPFLSSVFARSAKAQQVPARRVILMHTSCGCITNSWFPAKLDGALLGADLLPTSLAPLAPFASKLLMPRGIRSMNEWTKDNLGPGKGRGQGNDYHAQVCGSALTCQPVTPNSSDPFDFSPAKKFNCMPVGPSLDHVMARQLSSSGSPMLMNVAGQTHESATSAISYSAAETIFQPFDAAQAFRNLTGLFQSGAPNADTWAVAKGKAITDIVNDDLSRLKRRDMSRADKDKLEAWIELINSVGRPIVTPLCSENTATFLGATDPVATGEGDAMTRKVSDTMDNADLYSALAVLAAACDANPIIVLKYPLDFTFSGLGIDVDNAQLAHRVNSASLQGPCVANAVDNLLKIDRYYAQKFANLVKMLDSVPEDTGTVLDSSVAIWMNECSDGLAHNLNNLPIIQAGSGGGYFKTGKVVDLDPGSGATPEQMLGRSTSQCTPGTDMMVDGLDQGTGTPPELGNAPVNKYFCNIMNALGVRAGTDGFPAADGPSSEVTHFGYSDKTEDFCGGAGAVTGAAIHSPGGFSELKA